MSMVRSNRPGEADHGNRIVNAAIATAMVALAVLALLGTNAVVLAVIALAGLGAILIAADWRVTDQPFVMLV